MNKFAQACLTSTLVLALATEAMAVEWNVSLWGKRRAFTEHVEKLAELVAQKTGGEFTLNLSYGGLSGNRENLDGISIGAFEMAQFCAGYHADKNPSITVLELPFLGVSSLDEEVKLSMAVYNHPATKADIGRWNATLLMPSPMPQYNFIGVGDAPETLADFKGMTVRATGGIGRAMESIGAVPNSMSATEVRQALDSGVVTAVSFAPHAHMSFNTIESGSWWTTNLNPGTVNCPVIANTDALDALSDKHKDALLASIPEALAHYVDNYNTVTMSAWEQVLDKRNIKRVTYSEAELENFRQVAGRIAQQWVEDNAARGLPAKELLDLVLETRTGS